MKEDAPKKKVRLSLHSYAAILKELLAGPCEIKSLASASGMTPRYLNRLIRVLHKEKCIHIGGWEKDTRGRNLVRVWALGEGQDARRQRKSRTQVQRDYRAKARGYVLRGTPFHGLPISEGRALR